MKEKILIFDIETDSVDTSTARCVLFGGKSKIDGKYYYLRDRKEIQKLIDSHLYVIGYNIRSFDIPILERDKKIDFSGKIIVDLYEVMKKRANSVMRLKLSNFKLGTVVEALKLGQYKTEFDYSVLQKQELTEEEEKALIEYLKNDLEITEKLYDYLEEYFAGFKEFLTEKDVLEKKYLTASTGSYAYKVICNLAGLPEEYDDENKSPPTFAGGYVATPSVEKAEGDIYYLDFACIPKGEMIYTTKGYKPIEKVEIGDISYSADLKQNKIVNKVKQKADTIIELVLEDGTKIRQTPNHRILTSNGIKQAKDITDKDLLFKINNYIRRRKEYEKAYEFMGRYINDINAGNIIVHHNFIEDLSKDRGRLEAFVFGLVYNCEDRNDKLLFATYRTNVFRLVRTSLDMLGINYLFYFDNIYKIFIDFKEVFEKINSTVKPFLSSVGVLRKQETKGEFEVYDLTMERQESPYFVHNGIITHNSLYPHNFIQNNLFTPATSKCKKIFTGNSIYKLVGKYCADELGHKEQILRDLYLKRKELKKAKDPREYAVKIVINCFSDDTEVLTENGIKLLKDCKVGERVYSINPKTKEIELKEITHLYQQHYKGEIYEIKNDNVDLLITPEHKMIILENDELVFRKIKDIKSDFKVPIKDKNKFIEIKQDDIKIKNYEGIILNVTVKDNHTLLTGKNSKYIFVGNSVYGCSALPLFKQLYNPTAAADCTRIGRELIKFTRLQFAKAGYKVLYSDSVTGDMFIQTNLGRFKIGELFEMLYSTFPENYMKSYGKEYIKPKDLYALSLENSRTMYKDKIKFVIRHRVDKVGYILRLKNGRFLKVTEDHSLIDIKDGKFVQVRPEEATHVIYIPNWGKIYRVPIFKKEKIYIRGYVYDLETEKTNMFIANNFLVHNTDSVFVQDLFKDKKRLLRVKDSIVKRIKEEVPFPQETFDLDIDAEISKIFFFRGKDYQLKKKNYIYITKDGKIKIMGLPIIKNNASKLSKLILEKYIIPRILKTGEIKFDRKWILDVIKREVEKDISVLAVEFKVKDKDSYKNDSQIQAQIAERYGKGNHFLIRNSKIGVGKGLKYCTIEEAKKLQFHDFVLDVVLNELEPFIKTDRQIFLTEV